MQGWAAKSHIQVRVEVAYSLELQGLILKPLAPRGRIELLDEVVLDARPATSICRRVGL